MNCSWVIGWGEYMLEDGVIYQYSADVRSNWTKICGAEHYSRERIIADGSGA
jgi:hypothetical protein